MVEMLHFTMLFLPSDSGRPRRAEMGRYV